MKLFAGVFRKRQGLGPEEVYLISAGVAYAAVVAFVIFSPTFKDWSRGLWEQALAWSGQYGYWGAALFAFLAHTTIIIPVPYTVLLVYLGSIGLNVYGLAALAGLGAGIGELTSYLVGLAGGAMIWKKYQEHFLALRGILNRRPSLLPWVIFLFGVSPLPDDILLIPLGMIRYNIVRAIIPLVIGKIILTGLFALTGRAIAPAINTFVYQPDIPWASLLALAGVIVSVYVVLKIDWQELGRRVLRENGTNQPGIDSSQPQS